QQRTQGVTLLLRQLGVGRQELQRGGDRPAERPLDEPAPREASRLGPRHVGGVLPDVPHLARPDQVLRDHAVEERLDGRVRPAVLGRQGLGDLARGASLEAPQGFEQVPLAVVDDDVLVFELALAHGASCYFVRAVTTTVVTALLLSRAFWGCDPAGAADPVDL